MGNFKVTLEIEDGRKKIPFWTIEEKTKISVTKRKKLKLTDRYPQRAIIEEERKARRLTNDFVDYGYYEKTLNEFENVTSKSIVEKYGVKLPKPR